MREVRCIRRESQPRVHRLLPAGGSRRRETRVGEAADRDAAGRRAAITFPEDAGAAISAEMKADLEPAVAFTSVDSVFAFDPHLAFQPAAAVMDDCTGAALARLAMTDIHAVGLPRRDGSQLARSHRRTRCLARNRRRNGIRRSSPCRSSPIPRHFAVLAPATEGGGAVGLLIGAVRGRKMMIAKDRRPRQRARRRHGRARRAQSGSKGGSPPFSRPMSRATAALWVPTRRARMQP